MNKYRYLLENVLVFGIGNVLSKVVAFFLLSLFTRYLTPAEFGDGELVVTTISLLIPVLTLCISDAVMRYLLDNEKSEKIITSGILITIAGCFILLLLSPLVCFFDFLSKYYIYIVLLFLFNSFEQLFFNIDKGLELIKTCAFNSLVAVTTLVLSSYVFLVVLSWGLKGYILSIIVSHAFCSIYLFVLGRLHLYCDYKTVDKTLLKRMLAYSVPFIPSVIAWWLNSVSNRYLIVFFLGSSFNGLFSAAAKIPNVISIFTSIFHQAWTISGIKEFKEDSYSLFYSNIYSVFSAFMFILCSLLIITAPFLGDLLFKGDFYSAWQYVPFMILGALFSSLCGMLQPAFLASEKTGSLMISTIIGVVINIVLNVALLKLFGLQIAAIASFLSFLAVWIIRWRMASKIVRISINWLLFITSILLIVTESVLLLLESRLNIWCMFTMLMIIVVNIEGIRTPLRKTYSLIASRYRKS